MTEYIGTSNEPLGTQNPCGEIVAYHKMVVPGSGASGPIEFYVTETIPNRVALLPKPAPKIEGLERFVRFK